MRIALIGLILFLSACKAYNYAGDSRLMAYPEQNASHPFLPPKLPNPYCTEMSVDSFIKKVLEDTLNRDFPEQIKDTTIKDTLEVRYGDRGFIMALPDSSMMKAFDSLTDKIKQQYLIQDSIKHPKKII